MKRLPDFRHGEMPSGSVITNADELEAAFASWKSISLRGAARPMLRPLRRVTGPDACLPLRSVLNPALRMRL